MKKNHFIELTRFFGCYAIFAFHYGRTFVSGWVFVEYFFMLSGYFAARYLAKATEEKLGEKSSFPMKYTYHKMKRLLPYTTIAILLDYFATVFFNQLNLWQSLKYALYLPINFFLLFGFGVHPAGVPISENYVTPYMMASQLWYICAMIVALPIMLYLLLYLGKRMGAWIISALPLLLYGYLIATDGTIHGWHEAHLTFLFLDMRALAGLLLGATVYVVSEAMKKKQYTVFGKGLFTVIEVGSIAAVAGLAAMSNLQLDAVVIALFVISLSFTLSEVTYTSKLHCKLFAYLGKLSLPIYCVHNVVIWCMRMSSLQGVSEGTRMALCFAMTVILAAVCMLIVEAGKKPFTALCGKVKRLVIAEPLQK